ncbi:MAG: hypothetical protein PQJ58_08470 [Spirochaetales bacterium]|nr:hypothetical protein [Spirochaetales bacterium]
MKKSPGILSVLVLILLASPLSAQVTGSAEDSPESGAALEETASEPDTGEPEAPAEPGAENPEPPPEPELSLYEKTLVKDIETAGYYELVAWCKSLGLSDGGNADSLRASLFRFYKISPSPQKTQDSNTSVITVRSAYHTDYFTIEENDQQMIVLKGDVEVEMVESGANPRTHIIQSEELIFNQTNQVITAKGNLKYTLISKDSEDIFYGDTLDFSVSSWNGLIFKGTSLRDEEVEGEEQTFYFSGDVLRKSGKGGIFILEDGLIKTQDRPDPDFHLKARKLWLMGLGEWGILSGVLYVGHVPLLYIPFYFKPGNDLIFNPVVGSKTGKGTFIQTTTYLLGQKPESEGGDSSFFNLGGGAKNYVLVREGLYLFKEEKTDKDPGTEDYLKFMTDWYSKLGAYSGFSGSFNNHGYLKSAEFTSGIGVSRNVDSGENIYFENDSGSYEPQWNSSVLGDTELPFRWGNDLSFQAGDFTGNLRFYSDPFFNVDFMDREENFDWLSSLLTSDDSEDRTQDTITDMDWVVSYSKTFSPEFMKPFVQSISLSQVRMNLEWNRRDNTAVDSTLSPSRVFFYPEKLNLPQASLIMSGSPLSFSTRDGWGWDFQGDEEEEDQRAELTPPWEENAENEEEAEKTERGRLQPGETWSALFTSTKPQYYSGKLTYSLNSDFNLEGFTDNAEWEQPGDIDFKMAESYIVSNNRFTSKVDNSILDSRIVVTNNNSYTNNYRTHLNAFGVEEGDLEYSQLLSDYQARSIDWNNAFQTSVYPFKMNKFFNATRMSYNLDNQLYKKTFESYEEGGVPVYDEVWGSWDEDTVNQHKAGMLLKYDGEYIFASSDSSYNLPPLDSRESYTSTVGYDVFNWKTSVSQTSIREEEEWTFQPFILSSTYKPIEKITLSQSLEYDVEKKELSKSVSSVSVFGLYSTYTHEYTTPYSWDLENSSWIAGEDAFVPSTFTTGYKYELSQWNFWHNRMNLTTNVNLGWTSNLQQFNDSSLNFSWGFNYRIHQFLDFKFTMSTRNSNMYLYFEKYRDQLGIQEDYSFWKDLAKSFNFFSPDQQDRYDSNFNLQSIDLELVHHLRDWDLTFLYSGTPRLENKSYDWYSEFSIAIIWNPIPQIKSLVQRKGDDWTVDNR